MTGGTLKAGRKRAGLTQSQLARLLGVTQPYLSLLEGGKRRVPDRLARTLARVLDSPPTELPVSLSTRTVSRATSARVAYEFAQLDYPGFAYLRKGKATRNPAELLLNALALDDLEVRLAEALPWLLLRFDRLDVGLVVRQAKLQDLQNRLGFVVALAREVAERNPSYLNRLGELREFERRLEPSRLAREDSFGGRARTDRMKAWVRDHRSEAAKRWNVLTDLRTEHLPYAGQATGSVAELPSGG